MRIFRFLDGHEVGDFRDAIDGQKTREEDIRIGQVELL